MQLRQTIMYVCTTLYDMRKKQGKSEEKGEKKERPRKEKSRYAEAAIDLILQQEIPRSRELVLLEMQSAPVKEQAPSLFSFSHPIISSHCHFNPIGSHTNESLRPRYFKKYSVQFKRRSCFSLSWILFLSLSLSLCPLFLRQIFILCFSSVHLFATSFLTDCILTPYRYNRSCSLPIVSFNEYRLTSEVDCFGE